MFKRVKEYIKRETREMLLALGALILICFGFLAYLKYVGIPMTRAHNLYNQAVLALEKGDKEKAISYMQDSLKVWKTEEVETELNTLIETQE
ncbi:MAG TPA: hypothetical protein PKU95_03510 [Candidatus Dojkabacteria bacterium]|nr:hypothetical protein [Candidatus Dojkabacteria bacterium]